MHMAHRHTSRQNNHTCKIKINLKIFFDKIFEVFYALRKKQNKKKTPKQGTVANVLILALRRKRKVGL